jgi:ATP-dependent DNA ligase
MQFSTLCETYLAVSKTTKRLEKTALIAQLLAEVPDADMADILMLLRGRVYPEWDQTQIGISTKLATKAISLAAGESEDKVVKLMKKEGDLGVVAQMLLVKKKQHTLASQELTIKDVTRGVRKLSALEGHGSVDQKLKTIAQLLGNATGSEGRFLIRILLEDLRVGIAEGTIRDAIIQYALKHHEQQLHETEIPAEVAVRWKQAVQDAIDKSNDVAKVAVTAKRDGLAGLDKIDLTVGTPIRVMLAQKERVIGAALDRVGRPAALEYKYDGFRCISGGTPIYTKEAGLLSVEDVKEGMTVLTHTGKFRRVVALHTRIIDPGEQVFQLQSWLGHKFKITAGHRVYVLRNNVPTWVPVELLTPQDRLVFPLPASGVASPLGRRLVLRDDAGYEKTIPTNIFFFRFLGYWIGDGFTNEHHHTERVGLIFNMRTQRSLCEQYMRGLRTHFRLQSLSQNEHNGGLYLYWHDKPLRIWLSTHFRRDWKGKCLPWWFQGIGEPQFRAFLRGWIESDGHVDDQGRTSITTKERDLAMAVQLLALRHHVLLSVTKFRVKLATYYRIGVCKSSRAAKISAGRVEVKILRLEKLERPDPRLRVYNLQVAEDESYCTTLVALHNCQIHKHGKTVTLYTRRLENVTAQFPEVVKLAGELLKEDCILDSEAVGYDPKTGRYQPFQQISQRIRRKYDIEQLAKELPVELNVFDVLHHGGEAVYLKPFTERRALLERLIPHKPRHIKPSTLLVTADDAAATKFYEESLAAGNEGIMLKALDAPYKPGSRVGFMVKLKPVLDTLDVVIVGAEWGEGKRSGWLTSFTIAVQDDDGGLVEIGRVGTGLKELEQEGGTTFDALTNLLKDSITEEHGKEVLLRPDIVIEVQFEEIQASPSYSSGFALRFPRFVKLRQDRRPDEVSTLADVMDAYEGQRGRNK